MWLVIRPLVTSKILLIYRCYAIPMARYQKTFVGQVVGLSVLAGAVTWQMAPSVESALSQVGKTPEEIAAIELSVYYRNCDAARAAGAAPIYRGQPGYREGLDGDSDGIACEPYRGR